MPGLTDEVEEAWGSPDWDASMDLSSEEEGKNASPGLAGLRPVGRPGNPKQPMPTGGA